MKTCLAFLLLGMTLSSCCCMYKSHFDSSPGEGVACTSLTTLEKMIIESPCGEDEFLGIVPKKVSLVPDPICKCSADFPNNQRFQRRIWVSSKLFDENSYIYFDEKFTCDQP